MICRVRHLFYLSSIVAITKLIEYTTIWISTTTLFFKNQIKWTYIWLDWISTTQNCLFGKNNSTFHEVGTANNFDFRFRFLVIQNSNIGISIWKQYAWPISSADVIDFIVFEFQNSHSTNSKSYVFKQTCKRFSRFSENILRFRRQEISFCF